MENPHIFGLDDPLRTGTARGPLRRCARRERIRSFSRPRVSVPIQTVPEGKKPSRRGPPRNPGVRELVSAKRRWSSPQKRADALLRFRGWHERGYLPHRDEPGLTQFITFHLADAFPANLRAEWAAMLEIEDQRGRRNQLAQYLDKGRGTCWLSPAACTPRIDLTFSSS